MSFVHTTILNMSPESRLRRARKAAGLCTECGRNPATDGKVTCPPCRELTVARRYMNKARRYLATVQPPKPLPTAPAALPTPIRPSWGGFRSYPISVLPSLRRIA